MVSKDVAYASYEDFSNRRRDYRPATKSVWSKRMVKILGPSLMPIRHIADAGRIRSFRFADLATCRDRFSTKMGADFEWEPYQSAASGEAVSANRSATRQESPPGQAKPPQAAPNASDIASVAKDIIAAERFIANRKL
jgi:hypothetical protein